MDCRDFKIIIVGGGIAGLATAIALRGEGRSITVLEQSSHHGEIGAAISLQPNASKILEKWGLDEIMKKYHGVRDEGFRVYNMQGQVVREIPFSRDTFNADRVVYHRVDLLDALKEAAFSAHLLGPPAELKLASRAVDCDCETGVVTLEDGSTLLGDLVVVADGIHSQLRRCITGADIEAVPTGISAYQLVTSVESLQSIPELEPIFDPTANWTSMIFGHDCRIIMGPCRDGKLFSIVALVPDESMHEKSSTRSWTSRGSLQHLLQSFDGFPEWIRSIFKAAPSLGLWQLRDLDPLGTWVKGKAVLVGDASHAMLPTMGQGASQSFEDAEALQAYLAEFTSKPSKEATQRQLEAFFKCRFERVSLIQEYSRQQAQAATNQGGTRVTLDPVEFQDYSCGYDGAKSWETRTAATGLLNAEV
ncbi:FAD/NAD(P)-binding domain-containing protein [Thozetella sp. PMI_491]|nr:FAD/NAD(P)-binding domain-containing protein [Thozetella sp. PMI_491]